MGPSIYFFFQIKLVHIHKKYFIEIQTHRGLKHENT